MERQKPFDALLRQQIPPLRRYARSLTRNETRAEDLLQDCLTRAVAKQHLWQPGTNLRAWLFTIIHNQHVNMVRAGIREGIIAETDVSELANQIPDLAADASGGEIIRDLGKALAKLPKDQREVIRLVAWHGLSYQRAAELLGVPVGTIRSRLSRGRELLGKLLRHRRKEEAEDSARNPAEARPEDHRES